MRLLALDTATEQYSVALWRGELVAWQEADRPRAAAEEMLAMVRAVLSGSGESLTDLDLIAFGRGPGAFTGVRIAIGIAQGLAFAARCPLAPVSDLRALAAQGLALDGSAGACLVCQDARMGEVYWGCFERQGSCVVPVGPECVGAPDSVAMPAHWSGAVLGVGSGFAALPGLAERFGPRCRLEPGLRPRAREIATLAAADGLAHALAPEQARPEYLRDNVVAQKS